MGVTTYVYEITSSISPARLFKAFLLDADNIIGSKFTYVKHKVDKFDQDNFTYGHGLIEGDVLMGKIEKISNETKLVASPDGGSIVKTTSTYYTIGDAEVDEEHVKEVKEKGSGLFKLVGGYLHANPIC